MRLIDEGTVHWVLHTRDRACIWGLYSVDPCGSYALQVHHINKRSQLGDDVPKNLITLCGAHHDRAERREIEPRCFREALSYFYGYDYGEEDGEET